MRALATICFASSVILWIVEAKPVDFVEEEKNIVNQRQQP